MIYSTLSFVRCNDEFLIDNSDVTFTIDLITRSSSLNKQFYSEYQQSLYDIISEKIDNCMNYKEVAEAFKTLSDLFLDMEEMMRRQVYLTASGSLFSDRGYNLFWKMERKIR